MVVGATAVRPYQIWWYFLACHPSIVFMELAYEDYLGIF